MAKTISTELDAAAEQITTAKGTLEDLRRSVLEVVGIRLLSFAQQDYRTKARGGTGEDGIKWPKLQRGTLEARVRRRGKAKAIVTQRRSIAAKIRAIRNQKPKPKKWKSQIASLQIKRLELSEKLERLVDAEVANHEIGVDTGLQRSSASPGFQASDGKGGNLLEVTDVSVTVGYNREYSGYFDEERPLFPDVLPKPWEDAVEKLVEEWAERVLTRELAAGF